MFTPSRKGFNMTFAIRSLVLVFCSLIVLFETVQGEEKKTPIDSVDVGLTSQLNSACGVNFQFAR